MSQVQTRTIKFESGSNGVSETYIKLKPLTEEQAAKGYYKELAVGSSIEGILKGTRVSTGKYAGKTEFLIDSLDGSSTMVLANAGNLAASIERKGINVGDAVQIRYNGKSAAKSGKYAGTEMHGFTVLGEADEVA